MPRTSRKATVIAVAVHTTWLTGSTGFRRRIAAATTYHRAYQTHADRLSRTESSYSRAPTRSGIVRWRHVSRDRRRRRRRRRVFVRPPLVCRHYHATICFISSRRRRCSACAVAGASPAACGAVDLLTRAPRSTSISCPINSAVRHSIQFALTRALLRIFGALSKDTYQDICKYFGIWTVEEQISARKSKFNLRYCASESAVRQTISKLR